MSTAVIALDAIKASLRLINAIANGGQVLSPESANQAMEKANEMLETWWIEKLMVGIRDNQTYNLTANVKSYTIGPTEIAPNFVGPRPQSINHAFIRYQNNNTPIEEFTLTQYSELSNPDEIGLPRRYVYINTGPAGIIKIWPVPLAGMQFTFGTDSEIPLITALSQSLLFKPGYKRAFKYCLAVELAPEYGREAPNNVKEIAISSKALIKRTNLTKETMSFDGMILGECDIGQY